MTVLDQGSMNIKVKVLKAFVKRISSSKVNGTPTADKEIDMMNARREIRVRIPG